MANRRCPQIPFLLTVVSFILIFNHITVMVSLSFFSDTGYCKCAENAACRHLSLSAAFLFLLRESSLVYDFLPPIIRQYSCACFLPTSLSPAGTLSPHGLRLLSWQGDSAIFRARPVCLGMKQDLIVLINSRHCFFFEKGQLAVQQLLSSAISSELIGFHWFSPLNVLEGFCVYWPCFVSVIPPHMATSAILP